MNRILKKNKSIIEKKISKLHLINIKKFHFCFFFENFLSVSSTYFFLPIESSLYLNFFRSRENFFCHKIFKFQLLQSHSLHWGLLCFLKVCSTFERSNLNYVNGTPYFLNEWSQSSFVLEKLFVEMNQDMISFLTLIPL